MNVSTKESDNEDHSGARDRVEPKPLGLLNLNPDGPISQAILTQFFKKVVLQS